MKSAREINNKETWSSNLTKSRFPGPGESPDTRLGWNTNSMDIITMAREHAVTGDKQKFTESPKSQHYLRRMISHPCRKSATDLTQEKRGKTTVKSIWPNAVCYIYRG